jgi:hypothetical protein
MPPSVRFAPEVTLICLSIQVSSPGARPQAVLAAGAAGRNERRINLYDPPDVWIYRLFQ